jgi:hypothetical protein
VVAKDEAGEIQTWELVCPMTWENGIERGSLLGIWVCVEYLSMTLGDRSRFWVWGFVLVGANERTICKGNKRPPR